MAADILAIGKQALGRTPHVHHVVGMGYRPKFIEPMFSEVTSGLKATTDDSMRSPSWQDRATVRQDVSDALVRAQLNS